MLLASLPTATHDELHRLVHGPVDPAFLASLHKALATGPEPQTAASVGDGERILRRLRVLGELLPPARRLFDEPAQLATVHAWSAVADPSLCLAALVHYLLCLGSMAQLSGESEPLETHMAALESGRAKGVYLITEVGRANSHLAPGTRADFDPGTGGFVLHTPDPRAAKFGSAGTRGVPQTAVVLARLFVGGTDRGVFAFVVGLTDGDGLLPGIEMSSPLGLSALPLDYVQVRFHHVRVPYAHWLGDGARIGDDGAFHDPAGSADLRLQRTLRVGQGLWATMPAVAAATSRQAAVLAVNYARQRRTQGRLAPGAPLLSYRTQQRAVLGALADAFALTCAAHRAAGLWAESATGPQLRPADAAMGFTPWTAVHQPLAAYKAVAVRTAARVIADCRRRCGFAGHLDVNRLAAYHGFHHAFDPAGGDSQLIFYDIGRALAEQRSPAPASPTPPDPPPVSPHWWATVVRRHEALLTGRLRQLSDPGARDTADFDVWNPLLEEAGELGGTHAMRLVAEDLTRVLDRIQDRTLTDALTPLAALHGVMTARRWAGPLLTLGTLGRTDIEALSGAADRLCDAVLPHLPLLTEAFAHPEDLVGAPMAATDCTAAMDATLTWTRGGAV
ncbi:acyl-CoA dehydrogenase [Streptomyces sp. DT2A-34]|uniref:acyl-CoA dehydrogenase family protein n=1 Tax=Streptomyces sp. DT2A-34 TaxID=3051182 RepID=UPI00265C7BD5|nr:acyl-CoA dehydrogenase [Streptomyces sp. DT2A-34]MDO0909388.1 acyl-CoA dehydrogenase [Streptomyces sp. DT2A-34]